MSRPSAYGNVLGGGLKLKGKAAPVARPPVAATSAALSARAGSPSAAGGAGIADVSAKTTSAVPAELTGSKRKYADSDAAKSSAADVAVTPDGGHKDKKRELIPSDEASGAVSPGSGAVGRTSSAPSSSSSSASNDGSGSASKALSRSGSAEAAASDGAAGGAGAAADSSYAGAAAAAVAPAADRRTAAQKAHDDALAKRREELARKAASKTHRERVNDLNHMLSTMTEHYDLFRISYAGTG